MLKLNIAGVEGFDNETQSFVEIGTPAVVELEHSLVSVSKWEAKWELPFLNTKDKTDEQTLDYIRCMAVNDDLTDELLTRLRPEDVKQVSDYIALKMTATWFSELPGARKPVKEEIITSEVMYHWLVALAIDFQVQYWHLNRMITLVKVINANNKASQPNNGKKPTAADRQSIAERNRQLNEQRRKQFGTNG